MEEEIGCCVFTLLGSGRCDAFALLRLYRRRVPLSITLPQSRECKYIAAREGNQRFRGDVSFSFCETRGSVVFRLTRSGYSPLFMSVLGVADKEWDLLRSSDRGAASRIAYSAISTLGQCQVPLLLVSFVSCPSCLGSLLVPHDLLDRCN